MVNKVVADTSLVVKCLVPEEMSRKTIHRWNEWVQNGVVICAPPLLEYEVGSVLLRKVRKRLIEQETMDAALNEFETYQVVVEFRRDIWHRACEIARQGKQDRIYDSVYAAHAEEKGCALWTADGAFYKAVRGFLPYVNYLGDYVLSETNV